MAKDIFDAATGDEDLGPEHELGPEPAPEPGDKERARDESGRYKATKEASAGEQPPGPDAKATQTPPAEAPAQAEGETQAQPEQTYRVPLNELLSTRERAQAAERERDELKRAIEQIQRQQAQQRQQPQEVPDVFADPQAYTQHLQQSFQQSVAEMRLDMDLQMTEVRHPDVFPKAWEAFLQAVGNPARPNPQLYQSVMSARSPGNAIVEWHQRESVLQEVGSDPQAYRQRLMDELLNDPAFTAKVLEATRQNAGSPNGSRPGNVTRLPSLNRQTNAGGGREALDNDGSPEGIWDAATR